MLFFKLLLFLLIFEEQAAASTPNIIIMLMDDMGWGDLGVNGEPSRETPNLDKMATEGAIITDFYTGAPLCSPSRAALLTGRLPVRNGFYSDNARGRNAFTPQEIVGGIADDELLLPEVLHQRGYTNMIIGKWHLGHRSQYHPLKHGFHEFLGSPNCHYQDKPQLPVYRDMDMVGRYYEEFPIDMTTGESNMTQLYTQTAVSFIKRQAKSERPFFLYWTPDATHAPVYASKKFLGTSRRGLYGDAVRELDAGVGQILSTVKSLGLSTNTFVFFGSDNGAALVSREKAGSNGPFLCGKETTFEGGMRSPAIAWWPGTISAGLISYQTGMVTDLLPTVLSLLNVPLNNLPVLDGMSLLPALIKDKVRNRGNLLMAVRYGHYKMHLWTWNTSPKELHHGINYCPDVDVANVTTSEQVNHSSAPVLFHLGRDPGERYPINPHSKEYNTVVPQLRSIANEHKRNMTWAEPQLNWCDNAVKNWSPPGCERINQCLPVPPSHPERCSWPH